MEEYFEQEPEEKELFSEEVLEDDLELGKDLENLPI
jgi:hypothetical protein